MAAALTHFPISGSSLISHNRLFFPLHQYSCRTFARNHQVCFPTISASTTKKTRVRRKVKSNTELCNDIREFISVVGLPEDHVPSMKELSQHGRQDLAHIVRRRGYKFIKQLLSTSLESDENGSGKKEGLTELNDAGDDCQDEPTGQEQKLEDMNENLSDEVSLCHSESENVENNETKLGLDGTSNIALELSLQDKVAKFIQSGELSAFGDDGKYVLNKSEDLPKDSNSSVEEAFDWASGTSGMDKTLSGIISQSKKVIRDVCLPNGRPPTAYNDEESDAEITERENESEVDRLKLMLQQKEMELSQLKEQIEKDKLALSALQAEAENEISEVQKLMSEKEAELSAAEEFISDLKEVPIEYVGDGETVQVAGSFNGWHNPIDMDLESPSNISDPTKSRNSKLWSTVLWLYPGTYEIKFVIDGDWRIDPQRETVTTGAIQNNILRVDR